MHWTWLCVLEEEEVVVVVVEDGKRNGKERRGGQREGGKRTKRGVGVGDQRRKIRKIRKPVSVVHTVHTLVRSKPVCCAHMLLQRPFILFHTHGKVRGRVCTLIHTSSCVDIAHN